MGEQRFYCTANVPQSVGKLCESEVAAIFIITKLIFEERVCIDFTGLLIVVK